MVVIEEWISDRSTLYAVVRDGVHLPDAHLELLEREAPEVGTKQASFIDLVVKERHIRQVMLRPELPNRGVYAMYKQNDEASALGYSPSRMLCAYPTGCGGILICGAGFLKIKDEPIQDNATAYREAIFLADTVAMVNERIDTGEIRVVGNRLIPQFEDSLTF